MLFRSDVNETTTGTILPFDFNIRSTLRTETRNEYLNWNLTSVIRRQIVRLFHVYCSLGRAYEPNTVTSPEPTNAETKTHKFVKPPSAAGNPLIVGWNKYM